MVVNGRPKASSRAAVLAKPTRVGRRRGRRAPLVAGLAGIIALVTTLTVASVLRAPIEGLGHLVFDAYQRAAPRPVNPDPGVALVDIDEASIAVLGQWPWPRDVMAQIVNQLGQMGAAAIAFDMIFSESDRTSLAPVAQRLRERGVALDLPQAPDALDNDLDFATAISGNSVVLGLAIADETSQQLPPPKAGFSFTGDDPQGYLRHFGGGLSNLPVLTQAATGLGSFSFPPSRDNIIRTMPLVAVAGQQLYPALGPEALRVAQGAQGFILRSGPGGVDAVKVGALEMPSDPDGQFWIHYSGMAAAPVIPAASLLDNDTTALASQIEGRIVIIGTSAIGLRDIVATPLVAAVPGMFVHAELIDQILTQDFLTRPDWARGAEVMAAILTALMLLAVLMRFGPITSAIAYLALGGVCLWASWQVYLGRGLLLDPVLPLLCLTTVFLVTTPVQLLLGNRDRRFVRQAFGRYLSPTLVARLSDDPDALKLGGETRDVSVLFSDIRGFTSLSENLGPHELTQLLNGYLTPMTQVLLQHEATIDKYIGDAIMAFWNAPLDIPDHPRKACIAALGMVAAVQEINRARGSALRIGIGLHRGAACVGNLGSEQRFSYSAIGDTVNLASRVEGMTKQYGQAILVTQAVRDQAKGLAFVEIDRVRVVGRSEPVTLYALYGDEVVETDPAFRAQRHAHDHFLTAYRAGDFDLAEDLRTALAFEATPALVPVYDIYAGRMAHFRTNPPTTWDGIFDATSK